MWWQVEEAWNTYNHSMPTAINAIPLNQLVQHSFDKWPTYKGLLTLQRRPLWWTKMMDYSILILLLTVCGASLSASLYVSALWPAALLPRSVGPHPVQVCWCRMPNNPLWTQSGTEQDHLPVWIKKMHPQLCKPQGTQLCRLPLCMPKHLLPVPQILESKDLQLWLPTSSVSIWHEIWLELLHLCV